MDCIFCRIVRGEAPAYRLYEDEHTIAFLDIFPVTDGHTLIVTKEHYDDLFAATPASLVGIAATAKRVAHALRTVLAPAGLLVAQLNGAAAGQTVFHYHMHLLPRADGEGFALHTRVPGDPARLSQLQTLLAAALE